MQSSMSSISQEKKPWQNLPKQKQYKSDADGWGDRRVCTFSRGASLERNIVVVVFSIATHLHG